MLCDHLKGQDGVGVRVRFKRGGHMYVCKLICFSGAQLFVNLWTGAFQVPLSMGFSRQEYWSGLPCSPPGDLRHSGIEPTSLMSLALVGGSFTTSDIWEAPSLRLNLSK